MCPSVPALCLGTVEAPASEVDVAADRRTHGVLVVGAPGSGRGDLMAQLAIDDFAAGVGGLVVGRHDMITAIANGISPEREHEVVWITARSDRAPMWPAFACADDDEEKEVFAAALIQTWRSHTLDDSLRVRAQSILSHLLRMPFVHGAVSPVELVAFLIDPEYRSTKIHALDGSQEDLELYFYWEKLLAEQIGKPRFQDWAHPVITRLTPYLSNRWLRRATGCLHDRSAGDESRLVAASVIWEEGNDISEAGLFGNSLAWVNLAIGGNGKHVRRWIKLGNEIEQFLTDYSSRSLTTSLAFPDGVPGMPTAGADQDDSALMAPSEDEEREYGPAIRDEIPRRRRRRAWRRLEEQILLPRRIVAREAIHIPDMMADGRIILLELPAGNEEVARSVSSLAIAGAMVHAYRQAQLPPSCGRPLVVYMDDVVSMLPDSPDFVPLFREAGVALVMGSNGIKEVGLDRSAVLGAMGRQMGTIVALKQAPAERLAMGNFLGCSVERLVTATGNSRHGLLVDLETDPSGRQFLVRDFAEAATERPGNASRIKDSSLARNYADASNADAGYVDRAKAVSGNYNRAGSAVNVIGTRASAARTGGRS